MSVPADRPVFGLKPGRRLCRAWRPSGATRAGPCCCAYTPRQWDQKRKCAVKPDLAPYSSPSPQDFSSWNAVQQPRTRLMRLPCLDANLGFSSKGTSPKTAARWPPPAGGPGQKGLRTSGSGGDAHLRARRPLRSVVCHHTLFGPGQDHRRVTLVKRASADDAHLLALAVAQSTVTAHLRV